MSEAVNSNHDAESLPSGEPNPSVVSSSKSVPAVAAAELNDDWQTVDFPGALPIHQLEQASSLPHTADPDTESLQNLVHYLRRENASLRSQVIQLEQDLSQVQVELQLEVARFYCKEAEGQAADNLVNSSPPYEDSELGAAQAQIQHLTQDLEQSQLTVQQQQHLINSLTEQLGTSQDRIAQLERDCALSQQRYTDQGQQVIQLENTCNDLRVRLNRQQQQTLQFKAALEKSLEMPSAITSDHILSDTIIPFPTPNAAETQAFIPKAQPVQPWSETAEATSVRGHAVPPRSQAKELPNLLKLFNNDAPVHSHPSDVLGDEVGVEMLDLTTPPPELLALVNSAAPPEIPAPTQSVNPDLDALFPDDVPPIAILPDAPAEEAIFDLSPFLEAGEVDPASLAAVKSIAVPEAIATAPEPEAEIPLNPPQENNLWADLARLIEPDMVTENAAIPPDLMISAESQSDLQVNAHQRIEAIAMNELNLTQEIEPEAEGPYPVERSALDSPAANPFADQPAQPTFEAPWVVEMSPGSPFITVKSPAAARTVVNEGFPEPDVPTVSSLESTSVESSPVLPSPVLHPFRPAKKLKSMASVDLPSFPRTAL